MNLNCDNVNHSIDIISQNVFTIMTSGAHIYEGINHRNYRFSWHTSN